MLFAICLTMQPIDYNRLIDAIAMVESGNNYEIRGGALQWTEATWKEEAPYMSYILAMHKPTSTILAKTRLRRFSATLISKGVDPSPYSLALLWRYGLKGGMEKITLNERNDYATRVENIYESP